MPRIDESSERLFRAFSLCFVWTMRATLGFAQKTRLNRAEASSGGNGFGRKI